MQPKARVCAREASPGSATTGRLDPRFVFIILIVTSCDRTCLASQTSMRYASRIVETKSGQIRGVLQDLNSQHLDPVEVFRGIPYAAAPIGDLRYRPPISPLPWEGVKLADTFGAACPQNYPDIHNETIALSQMPYGRYQQLKRLFVHLVNQSEDCLFLNLYIPGSGSRGLEAPYAVMVYVHGESFEFGSGNPYDGSVLASAGHVIVITLNYRLGVLGFLRTCPIIDKSADPGGNLALRDIAMGLLWVRENIAAFGGDPSRVTLLGHDTGAVLVNLLLLAPFGKGLFHRAVLSSGSALSTWAIAHDPDNIRSKVSEQVGCSTNKEDDIADCLRGVPLEQLMAVDLPNIRFVPRIGPALPVDQNNPDPGLDMERVSDAFIQVPLILGVSTTESNLDFNANDIQYGFEEDQRNRILRTFVRNSYVYHLNEIYSAIKNEYTDWDKSVLHPIIIRDSTMEALSDGHTVAPLMRVAFYHARRGAKTYFYHFSYQTKDSDYLQRLGSVRGEDIPYILGLPLINGGYFFPRNYSRQDQGVAEAALTFFTNFAKTGNPNEPHKIESVDYGTPKEKARFRGLTWEQYETGSQQYLSIASKPKMKSHYRGHKMAMWLNLIPQLHRPGGDDVSMRHHHFREKGDHLYAGPVREEWYTPLPLMGTTTTSFISTTSCSTSTEDETMTKSSLIVREENIAEIRSTQRHSARHYYSTTTALAITIGVGCVLLILNMLIFAGIYYQRNRDKKKASVNNTANSQRSLALTTRTGIRPVDNLDSEQNLPPSYTALVKGPANQELRLNAQTEELKSMSQVITETTSTNSNAAQKELIIPKPPSKTVNSLTATDGTATVKKRIQIQEISV